MLRNCLLTIFFSFFFSPLYVYTQIPGFSMLKGAKKIEIPFERQDNFIIVKVLFQGLFPLRFIIDTGAEHTILIKKEISDLLRVTYDREITIMGTDMKTEIKAYIARKIQLGLPNLSLQKDILVLNEDYFKFDEYAGLEIQGIIGAEVFKGHVVKFDYIKQIITVYTPSVFKESDHRNYEEQPIQLIRSKPYITTNAQISSDSTISLKLLLDTGASLALLLHTYSTPGLVMPEHVLKGNIGNGLGGEIEGFMGRVRTLDVAKSTLGNIISHFQELNALSDSANIMRRNGLIGGEILSRFTFIIDFNADKAYFKPNKYFKESFEYDKSGLIIVAGGTGLNKFTVNGVLPNTPSSDVDLMRGDEIVTINRVPTHLYSLGAINRKMQAKAGKTVRLVIRRDGKKIVKKIKLRKLI